MIITRGETLKRVYPFVMGKLWDDANQTESIRLDFKTAVNSTGDSVLYADQRYLLRRTAVSPATQWLYLPALRRVRIVPFQPDDPLLQSHMFFYDLTAILDLGDYGYQFLDANVQTPTIEGAPLPTRTLSPYQRSVLSLQKQGATYLITAIRSTVKGKEKLARFLDFREIAPGYYRPQRLEIKEDTGRTEFVFAYWLVRPAEPQLLTPTHLETQTLTFPIVPEN
jgi:hypothetical protein